MGREPPQLLKQRLFYRGRKFDFEVNVSAYPTRLKGDWECIRHPGGALAVPVTQRANCRPCAAVSLLFRGGLGISGWHCGAE